MPDRRKQRRNTDADRKTMDELYGQAALSGDSFPLRSDMASSSLPPGVLEERKTVVHEKRSISHEKRRSKDERPSPKYTSGEQKHKTASPKQDERSHTTSFHRRTSHPGPKTPQPFTVRPPPNPQKQRNFQARRSSTPRRESNDSERSEHRRKVLICVAISVVVGVVVGSVIGYGVYVWITSVQDANYDVNPNRNSQIKDVFNVQSTTIIQKGNPGGNLDIYNSDPNPSLDKTVGINAPRCGTLGDGVDNPYVNNPSGRKKRQAYDLGRVGRIVGGNLAQIEHHPWQVSLWTTSHTCGGSIIASNWILFAAHCVIPYPHARNWTVHAGESDRRYMMERGQIATATDLIVHESFDEDTFDNDLALLRLNKHLILDETVKTICLPSSHRKVQPGSICYISGWGAAAENDARLPHRLQFTSVTIINQEVCNADDWLMGMVTANMFCAGTDDGSRDACQGDSGGPLMCYDPQDQQSYLMGLVSWGIGCGEPLMPGVYANLPRYLGWIREAMARVDARYSPASNPFSR